MSSPRSSQTSPVLFTGTTGLGPHRQRRRARLPASPIFDDPLLPADADAYPLHFSVPLPQQPPSPQATGSLPVRELSPLDLAASPSASDSSSLSSPSPTTDSIPLHGAKSKATQRRRTPGHIPRPPNAFMVFRSSWLKSNDGMLAIERDNRQLSRITGEVWRAMSDADKAPYQKHAQDLKEEHARQYPNYRFSPKPRTGEILRRQTKRNDPEDFQRISEVAKLAMQGKKGAELADAVKQFDARIAAIQQAAQPSSSASTPRIAPKKAVKVANEPPPFNSPLIAPMALAPPPHPSPLQLVDELRQEQSTSSPLLLPMELPSSMDFDFDVHTVNFADGHVPHGAPFQVPAYTGAYGLGIYASAPSPLDDGAFPWPFSDQTDAQAALSAQPGNLSDLLHGVEGGLDMSQYMLNLDSAYMSLTLDEINPTL